MRFNYINVRIRMSRYYEEHMTSQKSIKYNVEHRCQLCNKDFKKYSQSKYFWLIQIIPFFSHILAPGHLTCNIAASALSYI